MRKHTVTGRLKLSRLLATLSGLAVAAGLAVVVAPVHAPAAHADAANGGGDFVPLTPAPLVDTRTGLGGHTGPIGGPTPTIFPVTGVGGVPAAGVQSVLINVETVNATARTFLQLWADGGTQPTTTETLAADAGVTRANLAVVPVGADGKIDVLNGHGSADIVINVQGYFTALSGFGGGGFTAVPNTRIVDTRSGITHGIARFRSGGAPAEAEPAAAEPAPARCNSFAAGTGVLLADGSHKPIQNIRLGDKVLATNPLTGVTSAEAVTDLIVGHGQKHLVTLTVDVDGDRGDHSGTLTATDNHPFWVDNQGQPIGPDLHSTGHWANAGDLRPGEWLDTPGHTHVAVLVS